jgi:hypothetical protein
MLTLNREAVTFQDTDIEHSWPLRVTAEGGYGLPSEIFVYHAGMPGQPSEDVFECVASVQQLMELPLTRPAPDHAIPYYRSAVLEVWCRSALQADTTWDELKEEAVILAENWQAAQRLAATDTFNI